jgi:hypothetical protein
MKTPVPVRNYDALLESTIVGVGASFAPDELAFLALTSKPEQHFRDRMAFSLYKELQEEAMLVCREWNRVDLAVLAASDQQPIILVELKWMYSMNAWAGRADYHKAVLDDEAKALRLASAATSVYTLLLATHPRRAIPSQYWATMKYASNVNRNLLLAGTAEAIAENAVSAASQLFGKHKVCASGDLNGGTAYGVPASVMWWLVKAVARGANPSPT